MIYLYIGFIRANDGSLFIARDESRDYFNANSATDQLLLDPESRRLYHWSLRNYSEHDCVNGGDLCKLKLKLVHLHHCWQLLQ